MCQKQTSFEKEVRKDSAMDARFCEKIPKMLLRSISEACRRTFVTALAKVRKVQPT
jgi:hypothetical protein